MAVHAARLLTVGPPSESVDSVDAVEAVDGAEADFERRFWPLFLTAFRAAHRILRDRAAAEDVAADALVRVHLRWDRLRGDPAYCSAWVVRVATNRALDVAKRRTPAPVPRPHPAFDDAVASHVVLEAALGTLPRRQRQVVALRYLLGLSTEEVARVLDIRDGSVRSHLDRALKKLRLRLGANPGGHQR